MIPCLLLGVQVQVSANRLAHSDLFSPKPAQIEAHALLLYHICGIGNIKMRHFIKHRVFPHLVGHKHCDGSGSLAHEPAVNLQTSLPPSQHSGDDDGGEVTEPASSNPHESHAQDHGKPSQSLSSMQETVMNPAGHQHCLQPTFEGLPPEIRLRIFEFGLGIEDLRAAVRASPALHQQYLDGDRKPMLRTALATSLGPAFVDMWATHTTSKVDLGPPKKTEKERIVKLYIPRVLYPMRFCVIGFCSNLASLHYW